MAEKIFDLKGIKFVIGFVCHGMISPITTLCFIESIRSLMKVGVDINYVAQIGNSLIDCARNNVVQDFLTKTNGNKLVFIDCDMKWTPEDLARLMCWSVEYPIVAAAYSTKTDIDPKFVCLKDKDYDQIMENEYGLVKVNGIGLGFSIIDRSVFETMQPQTEIYEENDKQKKYRFFKTEVVNGKYMGEDIYFFNRWVKEFNGEVWVDPDINLGHIGSKAYKGNLREALIKWNEEVQQAA